MLQNVFKKIRISAIIAVFKYRNGFDRSMLNQVRILSANEGRCVAIFSANDKTCDERGHLAHGFSTTAVDILSSFGLCTIVYGKGHVSTNINMRYFQPVKLGDEIIIRTNVVKLGKNLAFLEANLNNNKTGEIVAKGSHIKFITGKLVV